MTAFARPFAELISTLTGLVRFAVRAADVKALLALVLVLVVVIIPCPGGAERLSAASG